MLAEIMATGTCHTDAYSLDGLDSEGLFPSLLGHEGAGIVREVGAGVTSLVPDDHVIPLWAAARIAINRGPLEHRYLEASFTARRKAGMDIRANSSARASLTPNMRKARLEERCARCFDKSPTSIALVIASIIA